MLEIFITTMCCKFPYFPSKYRVFKCLCKNGIVLRLYFSPAEKLTTNFSGNLKSWLLSWNLFDIGNIFVCFLCLRALRLNFVHLLSLRSCKVLSEHISRALAESMYISLRIIFIHTRCARSSMSDCSTVRLEWKETLQYSRQLLINNLYMVIRSSVHI